MNLKKTPLNCSIVIIYGDITAEGSIKPFLWDEVKNQYF